MWSGTLFNDSRECSRIVLHGDFTPGECGGFIARGISVNDGYFTSQMNLTLTPDYDGRTVQCVLFNVDRETVIGVHTINFTSGIYYSVDIFDNLNLTYLGFSCFQLLGI